MTADKALTQLVTRLTDSRVAADVVAVCHRTRGFPAVEANVHRRAREAREGLKLLDERVTACISAARLLAKDEVEPHFGLSYQGEPVHTADEDAVLGWCADLERIQREVTAMSNARATLGGRPRKHANGLLALGIWGALERGGVKPALHKRVVCDCLLHMGLEPSEIDSAWKACLKARKNLPAASAC